MAEPLGTVLAPISRRADLPRYFVDGGRVTDQRPANFDEASLVAGHSETAGLQSLIGHHAIGALDHIFTRLERWDDLIDVLRRQISVTPDETQSVELQFRVGQVYHINLNNLAEAVNVYRDILAIAPEHQPSIQAMELIFAEGEMQSAIAEVLEPLHYAAQRWDQIVKIGEVKLSITEDRSDRFDIIRNVAEIAENKLGDTGNAYVWWLRAYIDDPSSEVSRLRESPRAFHLMEELGTKPKVTYLAKGE